MIAFDTFPTIPTETFIVLACVILYIVSYRVYMRRVRDIEITANRPEVIEEVTGEAGADAIDAPKGPTGPDGQLKMLKETQRQEYEKRLKEFLQSQDRFKRGLFALFWVCLILLIGNLFWYTTEERQYVRPVVIVSAILGLGYMYGFADTLFAIGDSAKDALEKIYKIPIVAKPENAEEQSMQDDIRNGYDYYQILNVPVIASEALVKKALQNASDLYLKSKPSELCSENDLTAIRAIIERAQSFLGDPYKRVRYDRIRNGFNPVPKRKDVSSTCKWLTILNIL